MAISKLPPVVAVENLTVEFPGVKALDSASLSIAPGEVRALMGRNGAGKSTMVRVLSGIQQPNTGSVMLDGTAVVLPSPRAAMDSGIATVHQELTIVPGLSVAENVTLGNWPLKAGELVDKKRQNEMAKAALDLLGEDIDISKPAGDLSIARQQLVEIARALVHKPKVMILDEPTSSLPATEVGKLLDLVRRLASQGLAVIYVSHRMDEIARVADSVTIVRDGRVIDTLDIEDAPVSRVAHLMVGEELNAETAKPTAAPAADAPVLLEISDLRDKSLLSGISLEVKAGEVVGIAGLLGAGRTELLRSLVGLGEGVHGTVKVLGKSVSPDNPRSMLNAGIALVPEDRKAEGLVLPLSVEENLGMSSHRKIMPGGILKGSKSTDMAEKSKKSMDIKVHDFKVETGTLSGGNQQKVVLGRCLNAGVQVLLMDEPTRGVDVHAKAQIYDLINRLSSEGHAVVVVSSEYEELLLVCHRILVMQSGQITEEIQNENLDMSTLMARVMETEK